jgi:tetratricopeptide (TPR) repeat protein
LLNFKNIIKLFAIVYLVISCLCLLFYANSLQNPFIFDDEGLIINNPFIKNWGFLAKIFASDLYPGASSGTNFFRPLQTLSFMWDYHFWELNPAGYHITNLVLHSLVSFLVFLFIYAMLKDLTISLATALLFAVCPIHTQAVTYISGRADMLLGLFLILSLLIFIKAESSQGNSKLQYLCLSLFLFVLGLLSKELAVVFPLVILAYAFYFSKRNLEKPRYIAIVILPFFVIDLIYIILRLTILKFPTFGRLLLTDYPFFLRLGALPKVILAYPKLLVLPINLHMQRTFGLPISFKSIFWSWFFLGIVVVTFFYILQRLRDKSIPSFMMFWFFAFLLPQSGIYPINAFVSEHFIYMSSISFFLLVSYLLNRYLRRWLFIFSVTGLIVFYGILTLSRNFEWQDPIVFYERIIKFSPKSASAHNNLGLQYERMQQYDKAISQYLKTLEINPKHLEAHSNLASLYYKLGRLKDSEREYLIVEKLAPQFKLGEIENNIGNIYTLQGLLDKALDKYKLALHLDPDLNLTHLNIAMIYLAKGNLDLATHEIASSLPEITGISDKNNPYLKIITEFLKSKNFNCDFAFYNNLAIKFNEAGLAEGSIYALLRALEFAPQNADAHFNLGVAYWKKGWENKAALEFKKALKLNPNHYKARGMLLQVS